MLSQGKGQVFAPDFLISVAVFAVILSVFVVSWNSILDVQLGEENEVSLYQSAERSINQLVYYEGSPEDWNEDDVEMLGLATEPHILSMEKLEKMDEISYETQLSLLNTQNFYLEVSNDSETFKQIGDDDIEGDIVMPFTRDMLLETENGVERVEVTYTVWS